MVAHFHWRYASPVVFIQCLLAFSRSRAHRVLRVHPPPPRPGHASSGLPLYFAGLRSPCLEVMAASFAPTLGSGIVLRLALAFACSDRVASASSYKISIHVLSRVFGGRLLSKILHSGLGFEGIELLPGDATSFHVQPCAAFAYIRARGNVSWWDAVRSSDLHASAAHVDLGADVNAAESGCDWSALHWAAVRGNVPLMELAISCGARIDARDRGGCTPLHLAARNDRVHAASLLVGCRADVDARGDGFCTPLHMAAYRGHASVMHVLISLSADLSAQCNELRTPLHWAAHEGHCDAMRLLIGCRADLNASAGDCGSPLHLAAFKGQCAAMLLLLEAGADVNAQQATGPHSRDRRVHFLFLEHRAALSAMWHFAAANESQSLPVRASAIVTPASGTAARRCVWHWSTIEQRQRKF
jgi:ankyrin repeat protein